MKHIFKAKEETSPFFLHRNLTLFCWPLHVSCDSWLSVRTAVFKERAEFKANVMEERVHV